MQLIILRFYNYIKQNGSCFITYCISIFDNYLKILLQIVIHDFTYLYIYSDLKYNMMT